MRFVFGKQDMTTLERAQENCWLLTNGLGGFMSASAAFSVTRCDQAILMAAVTAPNQRVNMVHRLSEKLTAGEALTKKIPPQWEGDALAKGGQRLYIRTNGALSRFSARWETLAYPHDDRDTMIALPGCLLSTGRFEEARSVLNTFLAYEKGGLVPNLFPEGQDQPRYNTADAALLLIDCLWLYHQRTGDDAFLGTAWPVMKRIVSAYIRGTRHAIGMDADGLIRAGEGLDQVTWMDVCVDGVLPTPRHGKPVEINAYWYNALRIMEALAPWDREFHPVYAGGQAERDMAYHQGTVWPFPLGACYLAWLKTRGNTPEAVRTVREQMESMEAMLREGCVGFLPEVYDGESPGASKGCFAQAWSVGELLRVYKKFEEIEGKRHAG